MRVIIFVLVICSLTTFGQNVVSTLASLHQQEYLQYVVSNGTNDFYVLEKVCYGSRYRGKNDSCKFVPKEIFIFIQENDSLRTFNVTAFDECGNQWSAKIKSDALNYYIRDRMEILKNRFDYETWINHVCRMTFYEIKNGEIASESAYCDAEIELEENDEMRKYNEGLKLYKFFSMLITEIELLESAR